MAPIRPAISEMEDQKISAVSNLAIGDPDVIPLWFGESDLVTPSFIRDAAKDALDAGHTFYLPVRGLPALRQAIRDYVSVLHDIDLDIERVTIPGAAMEAIMIATECLIDNGDNMVMVSPIWPNIFYTVDIMGGEGRHVRLDDRDGRWQLDLDKLFDACDARTKAIFIASPGNPTGWVMSREEQVAVLGFCRERGIWIIADEVYNRLVYDREIAPSFLEIAEPEDPVFVVNSFSKSWAMTGWRIGWMVAPPSLGHTLGQLSCFNNTGATNFAQHAAVTAITQGEAFIREMRAYARRGRDFVYQRAAAIPRLDLNLPEGAIYAFMRVDGLDDSLAFAQALVREARVGLAPGAAFGPGNEGYLRMCFACKEAWLSIAMDRLEAALA